MKTVFLCVSFVRILWRGRRISMYCATTGPRTRVDSWSSSSCCSGSCSCSCSCKCTSTQGGEQYSDRGSINSENDDSNNDKHKHSHSNDKMTPLLTLTLGTTTWWVCVSEDANNIPRICTEEWKPILPPIVYPSGKILHFLHPPHSVCR